ncbi:MAG: PTS sugar transporter subunit IIB [Bacilli bacterium]|nr:PTS sugar transporter subunit IIB [Bacilli bacterium]
MKRILLVCNLGMSTSMLVQRMEKAAVEKEIEVEITAVPLTTAEKQIDEWDVIMLGPQVRHNMKQLTSIGSKTPIAVIEMRDYGLMNGPAVLDAALKIIENNPK